MTVELLAEAGALVASGGLAVVVVGRAPRLRLAGLGAWVAGMALFLPLLAPAGHGGLVAVAAAAALPASVALALLFRRWPWSLAALVLLAIPARVPVTVGDSSAKLLLPLYAVVGGAVVALAWGFLRDAPRARELGPLTWPLALFVPWLGLSSLWAPDPSEAAVTLFFFVLPFALLALVLARLPWRPQALGRLYTLLAAMALGFAAVGIWQWIAGDVFWNHRVIASNAFRSFHRVNSVFWDPSMYGRFLVVAILASLVVVVLRARPRVEPAIAAGAVVVWVALLFSFSQSSFAALLAGLALVAVLAWRWRAAAAALGLCAAVVVALGVAAPGALRSHAADVTAGGLDRASGGRSDLLRVGIGIAADRPLTGVGIGGFESAFRERTDRPRRFEEPASHNSLVTVAAENGLVGLALFAWLLATGLVLAFRGSRAGPPSARLAATVAGVALSAVFVHSLFYEAFIEDPTAWALLALAALAALEGRSARPSPPPGASGTP